METLVEGFEAIVDAGLNDVDTMGDRIVNESILTPQIPFGAELLTDTPDDVTRLGRLACVQNRGTQVDDSIIIGTTGADN